MYINIHRSFIYIAKKETNWKQFKCPLISEYIKKLVYNDYYSAIKINKIVLINNMHKSQKKIFWAKKARHIKIMP